MDMGEWNMLAVVLNGCMTSLGALIGFFLKRGIPKQYTQAIFGVISLCVTVMGIQAAVATQNLILVLASMIVGTLAGTALHIEDHMQQFGEYLKKRLRAGNESDFVKGFVTLSSMQVIGAMAILGPVQAALGNNELLYFKSVLDFTSAFIFATIYGLGIVATLFLPLMTTDVIRELNAVGGVMILGIALNMFGTTKLKIADFLPALFIPMIYYHFIC